MNASSRLRLAVAVVCGLAAGAAAWVRAAPLGTFLDVTVHRAGDEAGAQIWELRAAAYGGGEVEALAVAPSRPGDLEVVGPAEVRPLPSGTVATFRLRVPPGSGPGPRFVRVDQSGAGSRTFDLPLEERR